MMGILRSEIEFRLRAMGFDVDDVMVTIPLRAFWTAIEEIDRRMSFDVDKTLDIASKAIALGSGYMEPKGESWPAPDVPEGKG